MRDIAEILEHWHAGRPIQAVARSLGADRKTIRKYVALAQSAGFQPGVGQGPRDGWGIWLDQNCPRLTERSRRGPAGDELAALHDEIARVLRDASPTTVWRRLHRAGRLRASLSSFRRYVQSAMPEAPAKPQITVRRPEPPAGEEAQVDYGLLGMWLNPLTGRRQAVNVFALVLSCSRHTFARAVCSMDQQAWLDSHIAGFAFFHGVPCRLVPDNLKTGVLKADLYDPAFNRGYEELARHYDFLIDPARAAKPTDKPRVERVVPFIWLPSSAVPPTDVLNRLALWGRR